MLYERWRTVVRETPGEIALRDLGSQQAWTFAELAAAVEATPEPTAAQRLVFPVGNSPEFLLSVLRAWRFDQAICPLEAGQVQPQVAPPPPGIRLLKTTSATTGVARQVAFTAAQLAADPDNIVATMGLRRDSPNLGVISLAHSYGFSSLVLPLLLHGIPLVLVPGVLPETLRQAAATGRNWTLPAVPALWRLWYEADALPENLRLAISAGAPLPLPLENDVFARHHIKLHNFLGSSECGGIAFDASPTPRGDAAYAGVALRGVDLSQGDDGCLVVAGAAVGQRYWPEADCRLAQGLFQTSDLVELRDGAVYLRGRTSDLINVAGRKLAPERVEEVLRTHPNVIECLVFGLPDTDAARGDITVAVVASRERTTADEFRQFLLERLPAWQVPREWRMVDQLPVNVRGKLSRAEWKSRILEG